MGQSILTTRPLSSLEYSQICSHSEETHHPVSHNNFSIVNSAREATSLIILEFTYKPNLNVQTRSHPLHTV